MDDAAKDRSTKPYSAPRLTPFGRIDSLTAGGSINGPNEFGINPMNGMIMGMITCANPNFMAPGMWC